MMNKDFKIVATEYELLYNGHRQGLLNKKYNPSGYYTDDTYEQDIWELVTVEQTEIFTGTLEECHSYFKECYEKYQEER